MSVKTTRICDRCGKAVESGHKVFPVKRVRKHGFWRVLAGAMFLREDTREVEVDLCFECENGMIRYLNGAELESEGES